MDVFHKGDTVRLTSKYEACMGYKGHCSSAPHIDWKTRTGVVRSANDVRVSVMWDGRKTPDTYPPKALERVLEPCTA